MAGKGLGDKPTGSFIPFHFSLPSCGGWREKVLPHARVCMYGLC